MVQPIDDKAFIFIIWASLSADTFFQTILLILFIQKQFCAKHDVNNNPNESTVCRLKSSKIIKYLQIVHILGYILCNISWIIYWHYLLNGTNSSHFLQFCNVSAIMFWTIRTLCFYLFLLLRLYSIFYS